MLESNDDDDKCNLREISSSDSDENYKNSSKSKRKDKSVDYETSNVSSSDNETSVKRPRLTYSKAASPSKQTIHIVNLVRVKDEPEENLTAPESPLKESPSSSSTTSEPLILSSASVEGRVANMISDLPQSEICDRILNYVEFLHGQLADLSARCENMSSYLNRLNNINVSEERIPITHLPSDVHLPVNTESELMQLNDRIRSNSGLSALLINYLYHCGCGKSSRAFMLSISRKVLSGDLAKRYSRLGRKSKKSFSDYPETLNVILSATSLKFKEFSKEELAETFGRVLAGASDWLGKRKGR